MKMNWIFDETDDPDFEDSVYYLDGTNFYIQDASAYCGFVVNEKIDGGSCVKELIVADTLREAKLFAESAAL
jgi:hypothetical protein